MTPAPAPAPAPHPEGRPAGDRPPYRRFRGPGRDRGGRSRRGGSRSRDIRRRLRRPTPSQLQGNRGIEYYPAPVAPNTVRIVPLGGVEEVGRNMCAVESGPDIFVLDAGFQFVSEDGGPGIDYLLPNTKYLERNRERVRAVIITHGHLDHIGGIPFVMNRFGNPPIYTRNLSSIMIQKRQE